MPERGNMHTVKRFETGHRISVRNPKGPVHREEPHLAYFTPQEFDDLHARLQERNAHFRRKVQDGVDPRKHVPRKRTRSFGQHARCWYSGRHYVWGGNGAKNRLMCSGARDWRCWNSIAFDGILAAERLVAAISERLYAIEEFEDEFCSKIQSIHEGCNGDIGERAAKFERDLTQLQREKENIVKAIAECVPYFDATRGSSRLGHLRESDRIRATLFSLARDAKARAAVLYAGTACIVGGRVSASRHRLP